MPLTLLSHLPLPQLFLIPGIHFILSTHIHFFFLLIAHDHLNYFLEVSLNTLDASWHEH